MTQYLRAQESTLADLFRPGVELTMPPYQRSYSWDKEEALDLLNDLIDATDTDSTHFMGAIVLVHENDEILIVDGQQRLTTLTMILAILRDLETDEARAKELHKLIADKKSVDSENGTHWRITLNHIDGAFFRALVQEPGATLKDDVEPTDSDSQKRMSGNRESLLTALGELSVEQQRKLADTMKAKVLLVKVIVPDWDDGYKAFRVLNTRGKAPNSHDIIKTDLLERSNLSSSEAAQYSRQWSEHEARLGGSGFDDLLNQIRVLYNRNSSSDPSGFRKAVLNRTDARAFLSDQLPSYVDAYVMISKGQVDLGPHSKEIETHLNHLRLIDHMLWRAPALKFLVNYNGSGEKAAEFFRQLERFAFAMMMVITDRKQRLKRYGRVADLAQDGDLLVSNRGPMILSRDEQKRMHARLTGRFGSFAQRRAIALRLNAAIEGGKPLSPDDEATVEHVLPRNLPENSAWHSSWPNPAQHRDLCDTIGNFVLLSESLNRQADNASFEDKKKLYFMNGNCEFAITRDLQDLIAWTPEIVRRRTGLLADILSKSWGLER